MRAAFSRQVDRWIDRGAGLDGSLDPFGPPLSVEETARALEVVATARFDAGPPFAAPLEIEGTSGRVGALLRPPRRGRAWCVLATPYGAWTKPARLGLYELQARALAARGLGVAAIEPPFHGARSMRGQTSGWGFVRADVGLTMRSVLAYAAEVAALARHLREARGAERVCGFALSLGGCALGLAATQGAPFDRLAFLAAADGPASFYATGANREARRRTLSRAGYGMARVVEAFRAVQPSASQAPRAPSLFAIPAHDLVVPAATQEAWRAAWGGARLDLAWHGHGIALASAAAARGVARWLAIDM
ncbi:MAG TPA: hypothetical protein VM370_09595 [Candidatus Thermoplasmatota archaeon]|nr:hypothetical protein [Candidatus Thermoplasmatota archaeon]